METFKQIIYRDSDTALMIIPTNEKLQIVPRFVNELSEQDAASLLALKDFCLTKVEALSYVVYLQEENRLDIQPIEGKVVCLVVSDLDETDKAIVEAAGEKCKQLLNQQ